jgi:hypothetical protein
MRTRPTGEQQPRQSNAYAQARDELDHKRKMTLAIDVAIPDFIRDGCAGHDSHGQQCEQRGGNNHVAGA